MSPTRQILHVAADLNGYGPTRQLELLAKSQLAAGDQVSVVSLAGSREVADRFERQGIRCLVIARRWRSDLFSAVTLASLLRKIPCDVLHLWGEEARCYWSKVRGVVPQVPILVTNDDRAVAGDGAKSSIPPGIEGLRSESVSRKRFLAEQLLEPQSKLIALAGPLTRSRCVDDAIWFYELVRTLDEQTKLLIIGDGLDRHRLERYCRLTSESNSIRFLGYREDLPELVQVADVFWHLGEPAEVVPLTVLEAMSAGVPVVARASGGCRKVIADGENGLLVEGLDRAGFARQTRKLLAVDELAKQIRQRAINTIATKFAATAMLEAYGKMYEQLMGAKPSGSKLQTA